MAIASLVVLTLGFFWGSRGLISVDAEATVTLGARLEGMLRMLIRTGIVSVCGVGALYTLAYLRSTRLGDLQLAAVRMLGIVSAVSLLTFYHVGAKPLEWAIEAVTQAAAFVGLSMVLFRLSVRNAATLLGITVLGAIGLLLASATVLWSAPPS